MKNRAIHHPFYNTDIQEAVEYFDNWMKKDSEKLKKK